MSDTESNKLKTVTHKAQQNKIKLADFRSAGVLNKIKWKAD